MQTKFKIKGRLPCRANRSRGITLFISVTIMAILLFVTFAVINIAVKSSLFTTSSRDSLYAFYAADAGLECALYWDSKFDKFSIYVDGSPISCGGSSISTSQSISGTTTTARIGGGGVSNPTSVFGFVMNQGSEPVNYCAIVTVTKNSNGTTHIKSRGYNTCDTNHKRRIERGIEAIY